MALATLAMSQPYRLGDFSYVTIKTGENYEPPQGYFHAPLFEYYFGLLGIF